MPESDRRHVDDPAEASPEPSAEAEERDEKTPTPEEPVEVQDAPDAEDGHDDDHNDDPAEVSPEASAEAEERDEKTPTPEEPVEVQDAPDAEDDHGHDDDHEDDPAEASPEPSAGAEQRDEKTPEPEEPVEAPDDQDDQDDHDDHDDDAEASPEPPAGAEERAEASPEPLAEAEERDEASPEPLAEAEEAEQCEEKTPEPEPVEVQDDQDDQDDHEDDDEDRPRTGRLLRRITATVVALLLVAAAAAYAFDLGPRWLGWDFPAPGGPAAVAPPPGLTLPAARAPEAVAAPVADRGADPAAVRRALAAVVRDKKLGEHVAVRVAELRGPHAGTEVYAHGPALITPASTLKLLTTTAALAVLGPDHRFTTRVVADPSARTLTLVGGGDPLLARKPDAPGAYPQRADVTTLARQTAKALKAKGRSKVRLDYDSSLFTGPAVSPHWEPTYVPGNVVSPISALWVDEGRDARGLGYRSADPAAAAADAFAQALHKQGITVVGKPVAKVAAPSETALTEVQGAPLSQVVQYILEASDNEGAEVLARQTALATGRPASFLGGAAAVREELRRLGVPLNGVTTYDGSGLSRQDRIRPSTLIDVLETDAAKNHPGLRTVVTGLPVAGFTGSLTLRFQHAPKAGLGVVRAKTGTLTGVNGLAGTVLTRDGTLLAFAAVADRVQPPDTLGARDALDRIAAALAACTCGATP